MIVSPWPRSCHTLFTLFTGGTYTWLRNSDLPVGLAAVFVKLGVVYTSLVSLDLRLWTPPAVVVPRLGGLSRLCFSLALSPLDTFLHLSTLGFAALVPTLFVHGVVYSIVYPWLRSSSCHTRYMLVPHGGWLPVPAHLAMHHTHR